MQIKKYKSLSTSRVNSRISSRLSRVGVFSLLGGLSVLAIVTICPVAPEEAQAATVSAGGSTLSISVSNNIVTLEADPSVNNGIALGSVTVSAQTTNETGYTMKLSANNTALKSADPINTATVPTLTSSTALTNFPANRWGYYFGTSEGIISTTYQPISTIAADIDSTAAANSTLRTSSLTIAARVDSSLPADTYSAQLTVSVVGNAPATSFGPISKMQEMTSDICAEIAIGAEGTLTDTRDKTVYQVGKMKDGKCWMLQNLALGSTSASTSLTSSSSNVSSSWTLPASYTSATGGDKTNTTIQSWNFGKWVLATPLLTTSCGSESSSITSPANCTKVGFVDVSSSSFSSGYTATTRSWDGANSNSSTLVAVNCTSWSGSGTSKTCTAGTYDAHYLVGSYYSWNAATAGTGGSITSGQATGSICPKGWKLPTSNTAAAGSFAGLLSKYGVDSSLSGTVDGTTYNIVGTPLRFVRAGAVGPGSYFDAGGRYGYYWSPTPNSNGNGAYNLSFTNSAVNPSYSLSRYGGRSVRCINDSSL